VTSVKNAGGLAAEDFGSLAFCSLAFDVVDAILLFFAGTASTSFGMVLFPNVSGLASARALRGRFVVVGMV